MRVVVVSCVAYRDAWGPWFELFRKFWPEPRPEVILLTDEGRIGKPWCEVVADFAAKTAGPLLLMQEDFFLNAPVNQALIDAALEQMDVMQAGMVRLYPCPGADVDYGHPDYGIVSRGTPYRISCQASLWSPDYLHAIASKFETPSDFEIGGTELSNRLPETVLAFKRERKDWPLSYYASAISRGRWEPAALEFCKQQGITVDTSLRPTA